MLSARGLCRFQMREKIREEPIVNLATLRMILDAEGERIIAKANLLDDVVPCAPRFDLEAFSKRIDRLMMGAVYIVEPMRRS